MSENALELELEARPGGEGSNERLRELLEGAEFLLPRPGPIDPGAERVSTGESVSVMEWGNGDVRFIPAFSSERRLLDAIPEGSAYLRVPSTVLDDIAGSDSTPVVVNPGTPFELVWPSATAQSPGRFAIGEPSEEPTAVLDAVRALGERDPRLRVAWRALVKFEGRDPEDLIGIELAPGSDEPAILSGLATQLQGVGGRSVVVVAVDRGQPDEFGEYLLAREPFWTRPE